MGHPLNDVSTINEDNHNYIRIPCSGDDNCDYCNYCKGCFPKLKAKNNYRNPQQQQQYEQNKLLFAKQREDLKTRPIQYVDCRDKNCGKCKDNFEMVQMASCEKGINYFQVKPKAMNSDEARNYMDNNPKSKKAKYFLIPIVERTEVE